MKYPDILSIVPAPGEFVYDDRDTMLYALGVGAGATEEDLRFVYEDRLEALPTMAVLMGVGAGDFITQGGIDVAMIVHGEHRLTIHNPLPPSGRLMSDARCLGVVDKGKERGALLTVASDISDAATGKRYATSTMTLFCRGDGGFSGPTTGALPLHEVPDRPHDLTVSMPTLPQQAALYRLTGDRNPLHIDPEFARAVGFDRPILHGLCTYGIACRSIMKACCDNDPAKIEALDVRFSSPLHPGETLITQIWRDGQELSFECLAAERGVKVIRNGRCKLR